MVVCMVTVSCKQVVFIPRVKHASVLRSRYLCCNEGLRINRFQPTKLLYLFSSQVEADVLLKPFTLGLVGFGN